MAVSRLLFGGIAVAASVMACSSGENPAANVYPSTGRTASASQVRTELARVMKERAASAPDGYRRSVDAWVARLSDDAICAASRRASSERVVYSVGVDVSAMARREIVFDLKGRRAAVFTKAAGDLVDDREHLFATTSTDDVPAPVDDEMVATRVAPITAEAPRLRAMVGPDGSPYGASYAISERATRAFAKGAAIEGNHVAFADGSKTAAALLAWGRPNDALALKAALLAVVAGRDVACEGALKTKALRPLDEEGADFDFEGVFDDLLDSWIGEAPSSDALDSFESEESSAASCATNPEMACTGSQVCTTAADSYCCADPRPVTKPCVNSSECSEGTSCVLASNEPDADGNLLTCADTSGSACGSLEAAAATTRPVSLKYEGTCAFLRNCSTWSKGLPEGQVKWGCEGVGSCDDNDRWVAGPNRSYCGKTVQFCKGGTCTTAKVRDVSVSKNWEGSNGVMDALGLPHSNTTKCTGGYGGGNVTVRAL